MSTSLSPSVGSANWKSDATIDPPAAFGCPAANDGKAIAAAAAQAIHGRKLFLSLIARVPLQISDRILRRQSYRTSVHGAIRRLDTRCPIADRTWPQRGLPYLPWTTSSN